MKPPRFSLLNLMLFTAIVALALTVAMLYRELRPLRVEVKKLRDETGQLWIEDESKIHAIRIPSEDDAPRRYRVWLPPGRRYAVGYKYHQIPTEGYPILHNPHEVGSGEYLISVQLRRDIDPKTGEPTPYMTVKLEINSSGDQPTSASSHSTIFVGERQNDWIVNRETGGTAYSWQEVGREVEVADPDQPFTLYRARACTPVIGQRDADGKPMSWTHQAIDGECDGFMVWISPLVEPATR